MEHIKYEIKRAENKDVLEIYNLMKETHNSMEDKEMFVCDDYEFVSRHINEEGFILKAVLENKIIAALIIRFPKFSKDNLAYDLKLDKKYYELIAHAESAVVALKYQGNAIFKNMLIAAEREVLKCGYKYMAATVSPSNYASSQTFVKCGFKLMLTKEKYGGLIRGIYFKDSLC